MSAFASMPVGDFLSAVAAKTPTPGGGAVASVTGALAAALAQMVVNYSVGKKSLAAHEGVLREALARLERGRAVLLEMAEEDAAAYGAVNELSRLPESDARRAGLPAAALAAVQIPLATVAACVDLLRMFEGLATITNRQLRSDLAIAAVLAEAGARASAWNVRVNVGGVSEKERANSVEDLERMLGEANEMCGRVERACG